MPTDPRPVPAVAIIVACFDADEHLAETLTSIAGQSVTGWECVVVDDGSADDTAEVARRFVDTDSRFRLIRQDNAGPAAARNTGLATVSGAVRLLAFVDGDDLWEPDALERLMAALDADGGAVVAYGLADYIDAEGTPIRPGAHPAVQRDRRRLGRLDLTAVPPHAPSTFSTLIVSGTIWPAAVAVHRRDAVERVGGFDPTLRRAEDWDLYLRMSRLGHFVAVDRRVAWYRRHGSNATSTDHVHAMALDCARVRYEAWSSSSNTRRQRHEVAAVWRRLTLRWTLWCVTAAGRALIHSTGASLWENLRGALYFAGLAMRGHPTRPDERFVRLTVRHVVQRSTGSGGRLP